MDEECKRRYCKKMSLLLSIHKDLELLLLWRSGKINRIDIFEWINMTSGAAPAYILFPGWAWEKISLRNFFFSGYYILNTFSKQLGVQVSESSKVLKTFSESPDRIYYIQHSNKFHWNWKCSYCKRLTHLMDSVETISYSKIVALNQLSTFFCHFCWRPILSWVFFESNSQLVYIVY